MSEKIGRKFVLPGELISEESIKLGEGVYKEGKKIYASIMGLLDLKQNFVRVIPITGKYVPHVNDYVIGMVNGTLFTGWDVDINAAYNGILNGRDYINTFDLSQEKLVKALPPGSVILSSVREISPTKKVYISMADRGARVLKGGRLLNINPTKIPRLIGKKSSMISMIKSEVKCTIIVGQNGRIWLDGKPELVSIAVKAIEIIEKNTQMPGLTDHIKKIIIEQREKL
jgi:exosome complex component RRP4